MNTEEIANALQVSIKHLLKQHRVDEFLIAGQPEWKSILARISYIRTMKEYHYALKEADALIITARNYIKKFSERQYGKR